MLAKDASKLLNITERTFRDKWVKKYNIRHIALPKHTYDYNDEDIIRVSKTVLRCRRNGEPLDKYLETLNSEQIEIYNKKREEHREKDIARHRKENMTQEQIEKQRSYGRIANMTPEQIKKQRNRGREKNKNNSLKFRQFLKDNGYERCVITKLTRNETIIDYHHIDPNNKKFGIAPLIAIIPFSDENKKLVLEEAKKCIPLAREIHCAYHSGNKKAVEIVNNYIYEHFGINVPIKEISKITKYEHKNREENIKFLKRLGYSLRCPITGKDIEDLGGLEFHHINPNEKTFQVCKLIRKAPTPENQKILLDEINKCVPLAPYIHQAYHHKYNPLHDYAKKVVDEYLTKIN